MATAPRTLAACLLAAALALGGCSGGPQTAEQAPGAEAADPAPDGAAPQTGGQAADPEADPTAGGEDADGPAECPKYHGNARRTAQARALMDAAEAAPGPPDPAVIDEIYEIEREVYWDRGCPEAWGDEDDERYRALKQRADRREAELETGARAAMEADPDALERVAEAEEDGRFGRGPDEPPPEPARSDADGPCQTPEAPWACDDPPEGEAPEPEPEPPATTTPAPAPTTADPEPPEIPEAVENFADEAAEVPDGQVPARRQPGGPVVLGAPVLLRSLTEWLCPPEEDWRAAGWTGCGGEGPNDYLRDPEMGRCHWGPVVLGVGDSYRVVDVVGDWRVESTSTVLGFSAVTESGRPRVAWALPERSRVQDMRMENPDGTVTEQRRAETGTTALKWVLIGGPEHRGLAADGTLAWGTFALPAGNRPC